MTNDLGVAISTGDDVIDLPDAVIDSLIQEHPQVARELRRWTAQTGGVGGRVILIQPDIVSTALQLLSEFDPDT